MSKCENVESHGSESYCPYCFTCHACLSERDDRTSKYVKDLEQQLSTVKAELEEEKQELYDGNVALEAIIAALKAELASSQAEAIRQAAKDFNAECPNLDGNTGFSEWLNTYADNLEGE